MIAVHMLFGDYIENRMIVNRSFFDSSLSK